MADERSISGNRALFFGLQDAFKMTCLGWYVNMQYLADATPLLSQMYKYK